MGIAVTKHTTKNWLPNIVETEAIAFFVRGKSRRFGNQGKASWLLVPDWLMLGKHTILALCWLRQ